MESWLPLDTRAKDTDLQTDTISDIEDFTLEKAQEILQNVETRLQQQLTSQQNPATRNERSSHFRLPRLNADTVPQPYIKSQGSVARAEPTRLVSEKQRESLNEIKKVEDPIVVKRRVLEEKRATAGPDWYNLPRTDLTPELKRDIQLLKMRSVLDPKRHYKKESGKSKAPEYSQVGTIIEGPTEFYSARLLNKERKKTLVDEVLAVESETGRFKQKYNDVQLSNRSGKKAFYKGLKAKRSGRIRKR